MTNDTAEGSVAQLILGLENKDTRLICAMSLCLGGQKKHIQTVISSMDKMIWDEVDDMSFALRGFGSTVIPFLVPVARSSRKAPAACAMRALGLIGGDEAIEALTERLIFLPTKSEPTEALVEIGTGAIPSLLSLTGHAKADVRAMAVFGLGKIGDVAVLEHLEAMEAADRSEKVRNIAGLAASWLRNGELCGVDLRNCFGELPS